MPVKHLREPFRDAPEEILIDFAGDRREPLAPEIETRIK